jgi:tetratricopeptide (TPR) repeat protein
VEARVAEAGPVDETPVGDSGEPRGLDLVGTIVGGCLVLRRIAAGGMGVVYEARQDPPGRLVALKLLRTALEGDESVRRFEREARTLGHLQHPGIAQIYGAGSHLAASVDRLPYFILEHVAGARNVVQYADEHHLDVRRRLELFARVCEAVHFGHTKGVIHRDLKPDNVLVDAEGHPKVIDFGIARTTEDDASVAPTQTGHIVGTVPYMSPEQVMGRRSEVDTRSDVYALGVILYELLTGRMPYDLDGLNLVEMASVIAFKAPVPPAKVRPELAGDVSVILQKALAKEPARRYSSAADLGKDVERFLAYTPIEARPPSLGYQVRLFARRNRVGFLAIVGAVVALLGATGVSLWFASSEARQRHVAEGQTQRAERLLHTSLGLPRHVLDEFDPQLAKLPGSTQLRAILAADIASHLDTLTLGEADEPGTLRRVADAYFALGTLEGGGGGVGLGEWSKSIDSYEKARSLFERILRLDPSDRAALHNRIFIDLKIVALLIAQSRLKEADDRLSRAIRDIEAVPETPENDSFASVRRLSWDLRAELAYWDGRFVDSARDYERVFARLREGVPDTTTNVKDLQNLIRAELNLAQTLPKAGRSAEVAAHVEHIEALARRLEEVNPTFESWLTLAKTYRDLGDVVSNGPPDAPLDYYRRALRWSEALTERDPTDAASREIAAVTRGWLAIALDAAGRSSEAVPYHERTIRDNDERSARDAKDRLALWNSIVTRTRYADSLRRLHRFDEAVKALDEAQTRLDRFRSGEPGGVASDVHASDIAWTRAEIEESRLEADPGASGDSRAATLRRARDHYVEARDLLANLEQASRLPSDKTGNLAALRQRVERANRQLAELPDSPPR